MTSAFLKTLTLGLCMLAWSVHAQEHLAIVAPFSPGAPVDVVSRNLAE
jgi:tripartite-type tricarboxylate transporter receptor subunit TctC